MSTKKIQIKKLEPNSKKSQTLQAALKVSHEIVIGMCVQHLISSEVKTTRLAGRKVRRPKAREKITHEDTTEMLGIALDHLEMANLRIEAYEAAIKKIKSSMDALHNLIAEPEVGGRVANTLLKKYAEEIAVEHYKKNGNFIKAEQLSNDVSKKVFDRDPAKYRELWKEKFRKENPDAEFPAGFENSTSWPRFADDYRALSRRTATEWLKEINGELGIKK
jgi:hypothetical protein